MGQANGAPLKGEQPPDSDSALELVDVPAAVVCATCGDPACPGCAELDEPTNGSGVVAIVPWERIASGGFFKRLWVTARLSTTTAFSAAVPSGDTSSALRFAIFAELFAVVGWCVALTPLALLLAPELTTAVARDPSLRRWALQAGLLGIPAVALGMVLLHAMHGVALDISARYFGSRAKRSRGLRFGLYACGWDLATLPVGFVVLAITEGFKAAKGTLHEALAVPAKSSRAYLSGVHQLDESRIQRASRMALVLPGALVVLCTLGGAIAALLWTFMS